MSKAEKIFVAGHKGLVGSAIVRQLKYVGYTNILTQSRDELDLCNQSAVADYFKKTKPDKVYLAAAKVGGIYANSSYPADFIYQNLMIELNVIHQAFISGVKKLLFLGSSCIYPRLTIQPMKEDCLLTGKLEPTNEPYAISKIAGIKLCESYNRQYGNSSGIDYRSVMPTNLYGPGDNYHFENSHVIAAMIRKFHDAKKMSLNEVVIWGTGNPKREFLYVDDMATASIFIMELDKDIYNKKTNPMQGHINIGFGSEISILDIAKLIADIIGFQGKISFDTTKPDGSPRKLLDCNIITQMGWKPKVDLAHGLELAYKDFLQNHD